MAALFDAYCPTCNLKVTLQRDNLANALNAKCSTCGGAYVVGRRVEEVIRARASKSAALREVAPVIEFVGLSHEVWTNSQALLEFAFPHGIDGMESL